MAEERNRNAFAAAIAVPMVIVLIIGALIVATSGSSDRGAGRSSTGSTRTTTSSSPATPTTARRPTPPYVPKLTASGDPVFDATRLTPPAPTSEPLPAVLTARGPSSGPVVTPATAQPILAAIWTLHARALKTLDVELMAKFETDLALQVDLGRCACAGLGDPFGPLGQTALFVPRQMSYPARFMAEIDTTASGDPWLAFMVMTRANASSPWLLAFDGGFSASPGSVVPPDVDADGYVRPATAPLLTDPRTVHSALAQYWRAAKDTGRPPATSIFDSGKWTTDFAPKLAAHGQGKVSGNGFVGYYAYTADPVHDGVYSFSYGDGSVMVCSAVRVQKTYTGTTAVDGPVQSRNRDNWGPGISPGYYRAVVVTQITVPCISVPTAASGQRAIVLGAEEWDLATRAI